MILAPKQIEFLINSTAKWNLAHGAVRSAKTVGTLFRFMQAVEMCPDSQIWMVGHTSSTIFDNVIRLILEERPKGIPDPFSIFRPFCTWIGFKRQLRFRDKIISTVGAKDTGSYMKIQGATMSLVYCDEMTLYPENMIDMIDTRLSNPHSMGIATMNPSHPHHKLKQWIDWADEGDPKYYALHFTLDDNPYLDQDYKERLKQSLSGVFYKRNYLGLWCVAEGAIFDFFDRNVHVIKNKKPAADYFIVGVDYGTTNAFAAILIGVNTGKYTQSSPKMWTEGEYYWGGKTKTRDKVDSEYADELLEWLEPYGVRKIYVDPAAASFKVEMRRRGFQMIDANNDVEDGIRIMTDAVKTGKLTIGHSCVNLIREIEGYSWDPKAAEKGWDEPLKKDDHAVDALRYAVASHKISVYGDSDGRTLGYSPRKL